MVRFNPLVEVKELGRLSVPKGKFSLFCALEFARTYQMINKGITEDKFRYLMKTDKKQREMVLDLMGKLGIGGNAISYGLGHLGVVQAFWDKEFPDMYRIVAFDLQFRNEACFEAHKKKVCQLCKKCKKCGALYRTRDIHTCGEKFCKRCMVYHPERQCFIKKPKIRPNLPRYRIVAYDLETTVLNGEHLPNLVSAAVTCSVCVGEEKECEICGEGQKRMTWSMAEGVIDPMSCFVDWIMGQNPLAELPKTLELDIPAKLYFPHKYNKNANFGIRLPHLPPLIDYCPDNLREETCAKLEKWYNENYETEFELGEQLRIYCESDVAILMAAVLKFRKLFLGITKDMDVVKNSVTNAGVVMKVFRAKTAHGTAVRDVLCRGQSGRMACVLRRIWEGRSIK
uniref:DNA-directed DNA polymerase n=1 Tax=Globodera rostochiensis TaxID=31243 RepID=A0A914GRD9_GLORO